MISCIFLFLQASFSYLPVNGECTCYYNITTNITQCSLTCQQQLVEADRLYMCPSKHFQQRLPFWRWILAEMFCIDKDKRNDVVENYQPSSGVNYDTPPALTSSQPSSPATQSQNFHSTKSSILAASPQSDAKNPLSYGSSIMITNSNTNETTSFSYPSVSVSSTICGKMKKARFLIPSSTICYYQNDTSSETIVDNFINQLNDKSLFINESNIHFNLNFVGATVDSDKTNSSDSDIDFPDKNFTNSNSTVDGNFTDDFNCTDANCTDDENVTYYNNSPRATLLSNENDITLYAAEDGTYVSSIDILFFVNDMTITGVNVTIERKESSYEQYYPLSINIDYFNEDQFQNENRTSMKSGNFGYAIGQPVIVLQKGTPQEEPFPVPFGIEGNDSYTPLLFGVDIISGFIDESLVFFQRGQFQMSKLAQGNPEFVNDWINVTVDDNPIPNIDMYILTIYYMKIGNVNNPQNMICSARLNLPRMTSRVDRNQKIFKCIFLKIANNPSHRYLQPNPSVRPIPPDTFYPFSSAD